MEIMNEAKRTKTPWGYTYDGSSDWSIGPVDDPQELAVAHIWNPSDMQALAHAANRDAGTMAKVGRAGEAAGVGGSVPAPNYIPCKG